MEKRFFKSFREMNRMTPWATNWKSILIAVFIAGLLGWGQAAQAQEYPTKPINLLVSFAAGGPVDTCARKLVPEASKILGQELVVINRPGGGGSLAAGLLASSKGDGYTLLAHTTAGLTNSPHLETVPYHPLNDVIPVIQFGSLVVPFVVRSDSPYKSFKDLVEFARKSPGKASCGNPGVGTTPHLAIEVVTQQEKVNIVIIPFDGSAPALTALLGGHITAAGSSINGIMSNLKAGRVRVLAVTSEKRLEVLPDVPTLLELGYPQGFFLEAYLISAPKGTPPAIVKKVEGAFRKAIDTPEFRAFVKGSNLYVENPMAGQQLKEFVEREYFKSREIIQKAKIGK
jgi:tripartite-type tricarboxylate transporter receptor subunit TctC